MKFLGFTMKRALFWFCMFILILLHQDYWQWGKTEMVFGLIPYPLAYHMALSLILVVFWSVAVRVFWPTDSPAEVTSGGEPG